MITFMETNLQSDLKSIIELKKMEYLNNFIESNKEYMRK